MIHFRPTVSSVTPPRPPCPSRARTTVDSAGVLDYAAVGLGALGVVLVGIGMWGSDRVVNVLQASFTGWP